MPTHVHNSTALLTFVDGEYIQDLQIIIDDLEVFNSLPGKFECHGIKTLASWPMFVTAVLNEGQFETDAKIKETGPVSGGTS